MRRTLKFRALILFRSCLLSLLDIFAMTSGGGRQSAGRSSSSSSSFSWSILSFARLVALLFVLPCLRRAAFSLSFSTGAGAGGADFFTTPPPSTVPFRALPCPPALTGTISGSCSCSCCCEFEFEFAGEIASPDSGDDDASCSSSPKSLVVFPLLLGLPNSWGSMPIPKSVAPLEAYPPEPVPKKSYGEGLGVGGEGVNMLMPIAPRPKPVVRSLTSSSRRLKKLLLLPLPSSMSGKAWREAGAGGVRSAEEEEGEDALDDGEVELLDAADDDEKSSVWNMSLRSVIIE